MLNRFFRSVNRYIGRSQVGRSQVGRSRDRGFLARGLCSVLAVAQVIGLSLGLGASPALAVRVPTSAQSLILEAFAPPKNHSLPDGVYLYGQTSAREKIGEAYMVFEMRRGQTIGAFYMPQSSFDCFYGTLEANKLALTVVNSYQQTTHPYAVGILDFAIASSRGHPMDLKMQLEGYYPIANVSENDRRILGICKSYYQQQIWEQ